MMKNPDSIQKSSVNENRFMVPGKDGLTFVLEKQKQRKAKQQAKAVYVPVTVLAPGMKF